MNENKEMNENKKTTLNSKGEFSYSYSSKEQKQLEKIREKYISKEEKESVYDVVRKVDESVTSMGTIAGLVIGIVFALIFGTGLSMILVWEEFFVIGIVIGVFGLIGMCFAYPAYMYVTKKQREKVAPEIIRLTEEIK